MTDFPSVQYAKRGGPLAATNPIDQTEFGGAVRVARADFVGGEVTLAQNDRVTAFKLPKGARPLRYTLVHGAFGASVTADIGTADTENLIASALAVATAGTKDAPSLSTEPLAQDETIYVKFEAANPADDQDFSLIVHYVWS